MTDEMMSFRALLEKNPDTDVVRDMIGFVAQRLMELEVQALSGAGRGTSDDNIQIMRTFVKCSPVDQKVTVDRIERHIRDPERAYTALATVKAGWPVDRSRQQAKCRVRTPEPVRRRVR